MSSYCALCQGIIPWFVNGFKDMKWMSRLYGLEPMEYAHHQKISDLESASQAGCPLCGMIFNLLTEVQLKGRICYEEHGAVESLRFCFVLDEPPLLSYEGSSPGFSIDLQFYSPTSPHQTPIVSTTSNHMASHPLNALKEFLRPYIRNCILNHPDCGMKSMEGYLPTRLLDVGPRDESRDPVLVDSKDIRDLDNMYLDRNDQQPIFYTTLSHCWGKGHDQMVTTSANLQERMACIPMSSLPKTFQDAVTVTRFLNVRYLWIDSFCILQDSREEWEMQSQLMFLVYNNASVNIAATSANNSGEGFLKDRIPGCELPLSSVSSPHLERTNLWIRPISPVEKGRLDTRAWVLQEITFAPRTLSFGTHEASFRCRIHERRESEAPFSLKDFKTNIQTEYKNVYNLHQRFAEITYDSIILQSQYREAFDMWYRLVEVYSEKNLTFATDKLPAISGPAVHFAGAVRDPDYYAGIWKKDLRAGLCWLARMGIPHGRSGQYIAPSWSWASLHGPIEYLWCGGYQGDAWPVTFSVEVLDVGVELSGSYQLSTYGQVRGGFLRLRGKILAGISLELQEDTLQPHQALMGTEKFGTAHLDEIPLVQDRLCCLLLGVETRDLEENELNQDHQRQICLLLKDVEGVLLTFQRIGLLVQVGNGSMWESPEEMDVTIQ